MGGEMNATHVLPKSKQGADLEAQCQPKISLKLVPFVKNEVIGHQIRNKGDGMMS